MSASRKAPAVPVFKAVSQIKAFLAKLGIDAKHAQYTELEPKAARQRGRVVHGMSFPPEKDYIDGDLPYPVPPQDTCAIIFNKYNILIFDDKNPNVNKFYNRIEGSSEEEEEEETGDEGGFVVPDPSSGEEGETEEETEEEDEGVINPMDGISASNVIKGGRAVRSARTNPNAALRRQATMATLLTYEDGSSMSESGEEEEDVWAPSRAEIRAAQADMANDHE